MILDVILGLALAANSSLSQIPSPYLLFTTPRWLTPIFFEVPIAKCSCGVPKHWSGAHCEMDKFDAMIGYLAAAVPTFCQVRSWCQSS